MNDAASTLDLRTTDNEVGAADWRQRFYAAGLDVSSRAGFLLGSYYTGASLQPNLLSRGTRDQALISGVAATVGYAWGTSVHSALRSTADRLPLAQRSAGGRVAAGVLVDTVAALMGVAAMRVMAPREHETSGRSLLRLGGVGLTSAGLAGLGADSLEPLRGKPGFHASGIAAALGTTLGAYALTRPRRATRGSLGPDDEVAREDVEREMSEPKAVASGLAVTAILLAVSRGESALSSAVARGAAKALGG
ncbi:MAG TPA: hypothetical protein VIJ15_07760, partial [Dermatophilaceae bacterium]